MLYDSQPYFQKYLAETFYIQYVFTFFFFGKLKIKQNDDFLISPYGSDFSATAPIYATVIAEAEATKTILKISLPYSTDDCSNDR